MDRGNRMTGFGAVCKTAPCTASRYALQHPVERDRAAGEGQHQRHAAVAPEAAVGTEVEVADQVVAPAAPHPVRAGLVDDVRVEQPRDKRQERTDEDAQHLEIPPCL